MDFEGIKNAKKLLQQDLSFSSVSKKEKVEPYRLLVEDDDDDDRDQFKEGKKDLVLYFDGKDGFFINDEKVTPEHFLKTICKGRYIMYNQRPELREIFEKAMQKEKEN